MKRIGLLAWVGMALFVSAASAQNDAPTTKTFRVKNLRSGIVAWWIDPLHNEEPIEIRMSRKAGVWTGEKITDPRRASIEDNPYDTRYSLFMEANAKSEKPIAPREAPTGSTPAMFALPKGVTHVFNLDTQNALLAYGTPAGFAELEKTIAILDQPIRMVEFEAKYFSLTDEDAKSLMASFPSTQTETAQAMRVFQNIDSVVVEARLKELIAQSKVRLINEPRVTAMNNTTATMGSFQTVPGVLGVKNRDGEMKGVFGPGDKDLDPQLMVGVATNFIVTPTLQNDDTISIILNPTMSLMMNVAQDGENQSPLSKSKWNPIPLKTLESINILANVKDGETIAVTGMTDTFFPLNQVVGLRPPREDDPKQTVLLLTTRIVNRNAPRIAAND